MDQVHRDLLERKKWAHNLLNVTTLTVYKFNKETTHTHTWRPETYSSSLFKTMIYCLTTICSADTHLQYTHHTHTPTVSEMQSFILWAEASVTNQEISTN